MMVFPPVKVDLLDLRQKKKDKVEFLYIHHPIVFFFLLKI